MPRLATLIAALAWPAAAWAEGATADPSSMVKDYGGWGLSSLFLTGMGILWLKMGAKDEEIKALNKENGELRDRRGNEADARAERFAGVVTSSVTTGEKLIAAIAGLDGRMKDIGEVVAQLPALGEATVKGLDRNADKFDRAYEAARNVQGARQ